MVFSKNNTLLSDVYFRAIKNYHEEIEYWHPQSTNEFSQNDIDAFALVAKEVDSGSKPQAKFMEMLYAMKKDRREFLRKFVVESLYKIVEHGRITEIERNEIIDEILNALKDKDISLGIDNYIYRIINTLAMNATLSSEQRNKLLEVLPKKDQTNILMHTSNDEEIITMLSEQLIAGEMYFYDTEKFALLATKPNTSFETRNKITDALLQFIEREKFIPQAIDLKRLASIVKCPSVTKEERDKIFDRIRPIFKYAKFWMKILAFEYPSMFEEHAETINIARYELVEQQLIDLSHENARYYTKEDVEAMSIILKHPDISSKGQARTIELLLEVFNCRGVKIQCDFIREERAKIREFALKHLYYIATEVSLENSRKIPALFCNALFDISWEVRNFANQYVSSILEHKNTSTVEKIKIADRLLSTLLNEELSEFHFHLFSPLASIAVHADIRNIEKERILRGITDRINDSSVDVMVLKALVIMASDTSVNVRQSIIDLVSPKLTSTDAGTRGFAVKVLTATAANENTDVESRGKLLETLQLTLANDACEWINDLFLNFQYTVAIRADATPEEVKSFNNALKSELGKGEKYAVKLAIKVFDEAISKIDIETWRACIKNLYLSGDVDLLSCLGIRSEKLSKIIDQCFTESDSISVEQEILKLTLDVYTKVYVVTQNHTNRLFAPADEASDHLAIECTEKDKGENNKIGAVNRS